MILCIDKNSLKQLPVVQKDTDLGELIKNHAKYFSSAEEALKQDHVPLDFMVTIRSAYTNQVLEKHSEQGLEKRYYINMTNVDTLPHNGYDLIMYLSSVGIFNTIKDFKPEFNAIMMKSQFCPIGLYNPDPSVLNPIIYSQVVLHDDTVADYTTFLKEGFRFVSIDKMQSEGNLSAILDTILLVKEEQKSESAGNNDQ